MSSSLQGTQATIFLEGLVFDYSHFIPGHAKCGRLHGHTSAVRMEVTGPVDDTGMVVDFAVLKSQGRKALEDLDHRLLCPRSRVANSGERVVVTGNDDTYGTTRIEISAESVFPLDGEATVELISAYLAGRMGELLNDTSIVRLRVDCREGADKGASCEWRRDTQDR